MEMEIVSVSADVFEGNMMKRPFVSSFGDSLQIRKKPKVNVVRTFPKGCGQVASLGKVKSKAEGSVRKLKIKAEPEKDVMVEGRAEELRVSATRRFPNGCRSCASLDKVLMGGKGSVGTSDIAVEKGSLVEKDLVEKLGISQEQAVPENSGHYVLDDAMQTEYTTDNDPDVKGKECLLVEDNSFGEQQVFTVPVISGQDALDNTMLIENTSGNESNVKGMHSLLIEDDTVKKQELLSILAISGQYHSIGATQTVNTSGCESDIKGKESLLVEDDSVKKEEVPAIPAISGQYHLIDATQTVNTPGCESGIKGKGSLLVEEDSSKEEEVLTTPVISEQYLLVDATQIKNTSGSVSDIKGKETLLAEDESNVRPDAFGQHGTRGSDSTAHPRISFLSETVEVIKNMVLDESSQSMKAFESKKEKAPFVEHGSVKNLKRPVIQTLPEGPGYYGSRDGGATVSSLDRLRTKYLAAPAAPDSAEQTEVSSKNLGPAELFRTLEALMSDKESMYQTLPRRRMSAHRDFPAGCGMKTVFASMRECQESASMRETFDSKLKQTKQGSTQTASGHAQATVRIIPKKHNFVAGSTSNNKEQTSRNMGDRDDTRAILARRKVKETLGLFEDICEKLLRAKRANPKETGLRRVDCKAATILKKQNKCTNFGVPNVGVVPGVEVGDKFRFRAELAIIGLHRPYQSGIDYYKREWDGKVLALSIVASGGYDDYKDSSDVLIYSGQGGNPVRGAKEATDQKLERGNLGLRNSMQGKSPVRVIRGFDETKGNNSLPGSMAATLTYDGLYDVERFWEEKGPYGTKVFKFLLRRQPGQPELVAKKPQIQKRYKF